MRFGILLALVVGLIGCADATDGRRALHAMGFTEVSFTGRPWFGCRKHSSFCSKFEARNVNGRRVEGVVNCNVSGCSVSF